MQSEKRRKENIKYLLVSVATIFLMIFSTHAQAEKTAEESTTEQAQEQAQQGYAFHMGSLAQTSPDAGSVALLLSYGSWAAGAALGMTYNGLAAEEPKTHLVTGAFLTFQFPLSSLPGVSLGPEINWAGAFSSQGESSSDLKLSAHIIQPGLAFVYAIPKFPIALGFAWGVKITIPDMPEGIDQEFIVDVFSPRLRIIYMFL